MKHFYSILGFLWPFSFSQLLADDSFQKFKVKRKNVFEFTKKPELIEEKDKTSISFAVKDFCDVTVAIEFSNKNKGKFLSAAQRQLFYQKINTSSDRMSLEDFG